MPKLTRLAFAAVILTAFTGLAAPAARADITVDVNQGVLQPCGSSWGEKIETSCLELRAYRTGGEVREITA